MELLIKPSHFVKTLVIAVVASVSLAATAEVQVPSGWLLKPTTKAGVKEFHLLAGAVAADFGDGRRADVIGYNGSTSGPVLVVNQGERFSVLLTNQQRAWSSFSIHGLESAGQGAGLPSAGQKPIKTGETWEYQYTATAPGIYRYGPHFEHRGQEKRGLVGAVLVVDKAAENDQHVVLTVHDVSGKGSAAMRLLNGRNAPEIDDIELEPSKTTHLHVLNLSPRQQTLQIPGVNILRNGIAGDTHTASRQGASFTVMPRSGEWWLYFADPRTKPFASASAMPGMSGQPSSVDTIPRLGGLTTKVVVRGKASGSGKGRLVSNDPNYGSPKKR